VNPSERERGRILTGVLACFFFSGLTGLVNEVLWIRMLGLVFGHTVFAITTVLAAFMGGLGLGSFLFGRLADRDPRPLRTYGLIEIGVGVSCLLVPVVLPGVAATYLGLHRALGLSYFGFNLVQFVLVFAVLLVPTTLMGATLPVLSRFFARDEATLGRRVGMLYALNTFGAVAGTALAGYGLLPLFGTQGTLYLTATVTLGVGALAVVFSAHLQQLDQGAPPGDQVMAVSAAPAGKRPLLVTVTALGLGVSGAASMIYEIAWTRALALVLGSSVYAFTAMLVAFLVGIALGSAVYSRIRGAAPAPASFALVQLGVATSALLILPFFERIPELVLRAFSVSARPGFVMAVQVALSIAAMLVPTLLIGASFPCAVAIVVRRMQHVGLDVGRLYSVNTLGAIVGTVLAGFALIPLVGAQTTVKVAIVLNVLTGVAVLAVAGSAIGRRGWTAAGAMLGVTAVAWVAVPAWSAATMTSGMAIYGHRAGQPGGGLPPTPDVVFYEDGASATVSVHRAAGITFLRVNGKTDASTGLDMHTQTMSAHLPLLAHPDPKSVLIIGLASGVTAGAAAQHPVERVDVVEIEPAMLRAAKFFDPENRGVLNHPRVRIIVGDGRNFLLGTEERYDVIISEPSNPWIRGLATLFSREFYALAASRLKPGGVMLQWVQGYGFHPDDFRMVVATYREAFPAVSIWSTSTGDYLLLGRAAPAPVDFARITAAWQALPALREDMTRVGLRSPYALLADFLLSEADTERFAAIGDVNTDDRLPLEFSAPRNLHAETTLLNARVLRGFRTAEFPALAGVTTDRLARADARHDLGAAYLAKAMPSEAIPQFEKALAADAGHVASLLALATTQQRLGMPLQALHTFERLLARAPATAEAHWRLSQLHAAHAMLDRARAAAERAVALKPREPRYRGQLARLLHRTGRLEEAAREYQTALEVSPDDRDFLTGLGMVYEDQRRGPEAVTVFERALAGKPDDPLLLHHLGRAYLLARQADSSTATLRRAAAQAPHAAAVHADLGRAYLLAGDLERAASSLERALEIDPAQPGLSDILGAVYLRLSAVR